MLPPKRVACFCKPSGISTSEGKQLTHILAAVGAVGIPHLQQGTLPMVWWCTLNMLDSRATADKGKARIRGRYDNFNIIFKCQVLCFSKGK